MKIKKLFIAPLIISTLAIPMSMVSCFQLELDEEKPIDNSPTLPTWLPRGMHHNMTIGDKNVYVTLGSEYDSEYNADALLFIQGYIELKYRAFQDKISNKIYMNGYDLIKDRGGIFNNPASPTEGFYPVNPVHGVTRIDGIVMKTDNSGLDDSTTHLTYYDRLDDGTPLNRAGYYCAKPTRVNDYAYSKEQAYKILENGKMMYYFAPIIWFFEEHHLSMYADKIRSTNDSKKYMKFNENYFELASRSSLTPDNTFMPDYNNFTLINELPDDVITTINPVSLPTTNNEDYWLVWREKVPSISSSSYQSNVYKGYSKKIGSY